MNTQINIKDKDFFNTVTSIEVEEMFNATYQDGEPFMLQYQEAKSFLDPISLETKLKVSIHAAALLRQAFFWVAEIKASYKGKHIPSNANMLVDEVLDNVLTDISQLARIYAPEVIIELRGKKDASTKATSTQSESTCQDVSDVTLNVPEEFYSAARGFDKSDIDAIFIALISEGFIDRNLNKVTTYNTTYAFIMGVISYLIDLTSWCKVCSSKIGKTPSYLSSQYGKSTTEGKKGPSYQECKRVYEIICDVIDSRPNLKKLHTNIEFRKKFNKQFNLKR